MRNSVAGSGPDTGFGLPLKGGMVGAVPAAGFANHGYGADVKYISLGEVIANDGSFDQTSHDREAANLVAGVAAFPVQLIVSIIKTIIGEKIYDSADWKALTDLCNKGNFIIGLVDERGQLQAYFDQNQAYVKGSNPSGTYSGTYINNFVSLLKAKIPSIETNIEHPMLIELIWDGLLIGGSYIRHFIANKPNSNISTTSKAYEYLVGPKVSSTSELKFNKSRKYAGVNVSIPGTSFKLIGAKEITGPGSVGQTVTVTGEGSGLAVNPSISSVIPGTDQGFVPNGNWTFEGGSLGLGPVTVTAGDGPANQDGREVTGGITLSDVFSAGSVESAVHNITRNHLVQNVAGLSASLMVNLVGTLSGVRRFNINDWSATGDICKEGKIELGLLRENGQVLAMFPAEGTAYVKAITNEGNMRWVKLTNPNMTSTSESPETIENRLEAIAKAANTLLGDTIFRGTYKALQQYAAPRVLGNGSIQVEKPAGYAGVTVVFRGSDIQLVAAGKISPEGSGMVLVDN